MSVAITTEDKKQREKVVQKTKNYIENYIDCNSFLKPQVSFCNNKNCHKHHILKITSTVAKRRIIKKLKFNFDLKRHKLRKEASKLRLCQIFYSFL